MITKELVRIIRLLEEANETTLLIFQGPAMCSKTFLVEAICLYLGEKNVELVNHDIDDDIDKEFRHKSAFSGQVRIRIALPGDLNLTVNNVLIPWIRRIKIIQLRRQQIGEFESPQHLAGAMRDFSDSTEYLELEADNITYEVLSNGLPAVYLDQPELGWLQYKYHDWEAAVDYAKTWLGNYASVGQLQPDKRYHYGEGEEVDYIEIKTIIQSEDE